MSFPMQRILGCVMMCILSRLLVGDNALHPLPVSLDPAKNRILSTRDPAPGHALLHPDASQASDAHHTPLACPKQGKHSPSAQQASSGPSRAIQSPPRHSNAQPPRASRRACHPTCASRPPCTPHAAPCSLHRAAYRSPPAATAAAPRLSPARPPPAPLARPSRVPSASPAMRCAPADAAQRCARTPP